MGDLDGLGYRDTTAVVVGCSTGIGEATLRILRELGARVHAVSRNEPAVPCESFHSTDLTDLDGIAQNGRRTERDRTDRPPVGVLGGPTDEATA